MPIYELVNPSDPYTFEAPNIKVAGMAAAFLSTSFSARRVGDDTEESSPVLVGWDVWMGEQGIDEEWITEHKPQIADALESVLIGDVSDRRDVIDRLAELPEDKREAWRAERQDRRRTSENQIGELAYRRAAQLRASTA